MIKERIEGKENRYKYILKVDSVFEEEIPNIEKRTYVNIKDIDPLSLLFRNENMLDKKKVILDKEKSIIFIESRNL